MLRRIAVVGEDQSLYETIKAAAVGKDVEVLHVKPRGNMPCGATAIVAAGGDGKRVLKAALALARGQEESLELLAEAIDCREAFRPGNSLRVRDHATRFAKALGLTPADQCILERAALVRDIGKLRVPNEILLKDGLLTYDEWQTLQTHTALGAQIIQETEILRGTADCVHWHHECYDGTGYPDGLEGEKIPFLARAMRILDVYCAMTSARHYREGASTHEEAIEHLRSESGGHFDPALVNVFIKATVGRAEEATA